MLKRIGRNKKRERAAKRRDRGFTVIQLLITIAIIAIVSTLAVMGITRARAHMRLFLFRASSSDWIPDLIEIIVDESEHFTLRLIELEAKTSDALISSRKYLPGNSTEIVGSLREYLER